MNWLKRFMDGRYGGDQLSIFLIILSGLLTLIGRVTRFMPLIFLAYILLGISFFRGFSKNISKRSMENYKFTIFMSPVYSWFKKTEKSVKELKTHRRFKCPNCKSKLRIPRGKGKVKITCPKCKTKFNKRS